MSEENETKSKYLRLFFFNIYKTQYSLKSCSNISEKNNKNEQIIIDHDPNNGENENPSETSQNNPITVTIEPNNNAVNIKRSTSNKNKLTMVVHDQHNNKIDEKIYGETTIQSVLNILEEELPKLLPTVNVHINVNGENTEEPSKYEDALSHIANYSNPNVNFMKFCISL